VDVRGQKLEVHEFGYKAVNQEIYMAVGYHFRV